MNKNKNLYNYVCNKCGSESIRRQAHCKWDAHKQQWEIATYADGKDYCLIGNINRSVMTNINYKRLLLMSLLAHYSDEGQCWTGGWDRETYGIDKLTTQEKEALQEVLDEVGKMVEEEICCDGFSRVDKICPKCNHKYSFYVPTGYKGRSQKCPKCKFQDPRK